MAQMKEINSFFGLLHFWKISLGKKKNSYPFANILKKKLHELDFIIILQSVEILKNINLNQEEVEIYSSSALIFIFSKNVF